MKKLSRNQIAGCISIIGTCLFLAAIFFLPCFTSEAIAQTTSRSGDDELTPVAHPSRLYGTTLPQSIDLRSGCPLSVTKEMSGRRAASPLPVFTTR